MKKLFGVQSGFFRSPVLASFLTLAIAFFLTFVAYALAPGGRVQAASPQLEQVQTTQPPQDSTSNLPPGISPENVYRGQVVSIVEHPLTDLSPYDVALMIGQQPVPLSQDLPVQSVTSAPIPIEPAQATATPTPAGAVVLLDTFNGRTVSFTSSTPRTYMGDGFTNNTIPGTNHVCQPEVIHLLHGHGGDRQLHGHSCAPRSLEYLYPAAALAYSLTPTSSSMSISDR